MDDDEEPSNVHVLLLVVLALGLTLAWTVWLFLVALSLIG